MNPVRPTLIVLGTALTLAACKKEDQPERLDPGYAYFPVEAGRWIDYAVDSIWLDEPNALGDTVQYTLREALTEDFTDLEGRTAQRLLRSRWDTVTDAWVPRDVWWQVRTAARAERTEENMRRVKLLFPPRTGEYWNTNATNVERAYELTYQEVDVPWSVNGLSFDSTLLVKTTYQNNLVVKRTYYERYAKHVGLVYREVDSSNTQWNNQLQRYETRGTWYKQTVTAHGQ